MVFRFNLVLSMRTFDRTPTLYSVIIVFPGCEALLSKLRSVAQ
uniref:Uncharacterized protein n=2 Tax=Anguilla anguilla TaxID=7936 RepID=A0A0E9VR36_ANGAN